MKKLALLFVAVVILLVVYTNYSDGGTFVGEMLILDSNGYLQKDEFSTDTTGNYTATVIQGVGSFNWDSASKRGLLDLDDNCGINIRAASPISTDTMIFEYNFYYDVNFPFGAQMVVRLIQDESNMYVVKLNDYIPYGDFSLSKYVDGVSVADDSNSTPFYMTNGTNYKMTIEFSPTLTKVTCANNTLIIDTNTTPIDVNSFEIYAFQVDMYVDNIGWKLSSIDDLNSFISVYFITKLVDVTDSKFNLTPFLNTNDPYGDINKDGICNSTDIHIWDNVWTSEQRMSHRQWCFQKEKKAKGVVGHAVTYNQLMMGLKWITNRSPILVYRIKR